MEHVTVLIGLNGGKLNKRILGRSIQKIKDKESNIL